jgi:hypothetical protein
MRGRAGGVDGATDSDTGAGGGLRRNVPTNTVRLRSALTDIGLPSFLATDPGAGASRLFLFLSNLASCQSASTIRKPTYAERAAPPPLSR